MNHSMRQAIISGAIISLVAPFSINVFAVDGPVINDTYISISNPNKKFGKDPDLLVDGDHASYIRIDLSTLPPDTTSAQIASAALLLWVTNVNTAGVIEVSPVISGWDEFTLTGDTLPLVGGQPTKVEVATGNVKQYIVIDLTKMVKVWVDYPAQNFGVVLNSSGAEVSFDSKEALRSHGGTLRHRKIITWTF